MKIILVRHGERARDEEDDSLTDIGKKQIKYLAEYLKNRKHIHIYTSELLRSKQTAEIISKRLHNKYIIEPALNELHKNIFFAKESSWSKDDMAKIKGLNIFLDKLIGQNKDILLCTNAGINRAIISKLLNIPLQKTIQFGQKYASVTIFEHMNLYDEQFWRLEVLNSTDHLPEEIKS